MDITSNNHLGNENSAKAGSKVDRVTQASAVASLYLVFGDSITDELESKVCIKGQDGYLMPRQTLTARVSDLRWNKKVVERVGYGLIPTGETRLTQQGQDAEVSTLVTHAEWLVKAKFDARDMKIAKRLKTEVMIEELKKRGVTTIS